MVSEIGVSPAQAVRATVSPIKSWMMWVPSVAMMLSSLLSYVDRQVLAVLSPMILHDTGLSAQAYANALSAFSIFYMIGNPMFGSFLDFIGLRKGMFIAVSLRAVASTAHAWRNAAAPTGDYRFVSLSSMRRLRCRLASSLPSSSGWNSPYPAATSRCGGTPRLIR